jgi:hypothetical protein
MRTARKRSGATSASSRSGWLACWIGDGDLLELRCHEGAVRTESTTELPKQVNPRNAPTAMVT